ncbi:hypothetical protein GCM10027048_28620 [Hymenobacter coalescens]
MKAKFLPAISAAALVVFTTFGAVAQTELPTRPDPASAPERPAQPTPSAPYVAPKLPGHYPANALGLEVGWGAPYGWGVEYARMVSSHMDVNVGAGIGVGAKVGVGARYFFRPERPVSGYLGLNLARTGRLSNVDVTLNQEKANYSMNPSGVLHLRGGLRWQPGSVGLLATAGYGARITGDPVVFNNTYYYGTPSQEMRDLVQIISPGGLEFSIGVLFGLGR